MTPRVNPASLGGEESRAEPSLGSVKGTWPRGDVQHRCARPCLAASWWYACRDRQTMPSCLHDQHLGFGLEDRQSSRYNSPTTAHEFWIPKNGRRRGSAPSHRFPGGTQCLSLSTYIHRLCARRLRANLQAKRSTAAESRFTP